MARVYISTVMPITLEQAWSVLRDFNGLPTYHPFFATSYIEDGKPADQIGCVRHFHDHDGNPIREELLSLSDREHLCCYRILSAPALPVRHYVSEMRLKPVTTTNQCFGEWWAEFEVDDADYDDVMQRVADTFRLAFEGVTQHLS
ncbi:SRPBCC family protein [Halomonas sabkhae]|uniref:SRPBCC family protein n=1 Tax=Halomonas sabkhae TaxID=626223 RepID=UPI0025B53C88|nr:SRPBCC family protein [Halomonas sabkhae]MDN3526336.1 SRPBCC family protein [Halomonas sabkhae]